ncbi:MAG: SH3 domain-containing protein [Pseudobdellovibrionaceae bacterium]
MFGRQKTIFFKGSACCIALATLILSALPCAAADGERFASLRKSETYLRYGPSTDHQVKWIYHVKGLPVKIIAEFEQWRKIEDPDGETGWVHVALLTSKPTAIIKSDAPYVILYEDEDPLENPTLRLEPGVIVDVEECRDEVCHVSVAGYDGFLQKKLLWGIE